MADRYRAGLAFGYIAAILILITGALLWIMLNPAVETLSTLISSKASTSAAQNHHDVLMAVWDRLAFFIAFLALAYILARSYFESEVAP
jgi:hypothetical protein